MWTYASAPPLHRRRTDMPDIPTLNLVDAWMIILGVLAPIVNQPG